MHAVPPSETLRTSPYNCGMLRVRFLLALIAMVCANASAQTSSPAPTPTGNRITILYDAFGKNASLKPDWGYSALVEFEGKRILFDTGNNAGIFEANTKSLGVDLTHLDLVVISHRHGDHISGLKYLLSVNPDVAVYTPADESFRNATPAAFFNQAADSSLAPEMRYFGGKVPTPLPAHGIAWPGAHILNVDHFLDITNHIHLISTIAETPGFRDMPELSLVLDTPRGPIVIVGCSHPGIENILQNLVQQTHNASVYEVIGGLHLLVSPPVQVDKTLTDLVDRFHVQRIAPGHCTGEHVFALLQKHFGKEYVYAGLGESFAL
jgi:7,8-dihydropterin-6-yl-methyl-4-(beta-D-ribofuranosyl)aminobenzene 5'-phosphate synthase